MLLWFLQWEPGLQFPWLERSGDFISCHSPLPGCPDLHVCAVPACRHVPRFSLFRLPPVFVAAKQCKGALLGQGGGRRQHHHIPRPWALKGGTNAGAGLMDVQTLLQHLQPSYRSSLNFLALEPRASLFFMVHRNCGSQISTLLIPRRLRDSSCCNLTLHRADLVQNPYSKQLWSSQLSYELTL